MFSPKTVCTRALVVMFCIIIVNGSNNMSLQSCQKMDSCSCVLNDGNVIDLHFAAHSDSGIPVFYYQSSQSPAFYKYSPCSGLPCGGATKNASLCLESSFLRPSADLGAVSSVEFYVTGKNITLVYHATNGTQPTVTSRVKLRCSSVEQFVLDSNTTSVYNFTLSSRCACPGLCHRRSEKESELSVGTILVLVFFSALMLYLGVGCVYRKAVHGGSCAETVPHREFWFSLPPLIKDGYMFFISPCLGNRTEYRAYDKL